MGMVLNFSHFSRSAQGLLFAAALLWPLGAVSQPHDPDSRPLEEWPVHAAVDGGTLAAEYLVRTVQHEGESFISPDHLVVEVLFRPDAGVRVPLSHSNFTLMINGKKPPILPEGPQLVAAGLKYPDWRMRPSGEVMVGAGDSVVIIGRQPVEPRFPGDPRPQQRRPGHGGRVPRQEEADGLKANKEAAYTPAEAAVRAALPEGPSVEKPVRGFLYFPHRGKPSSVKTLDLIYSGKMGEATLRLFSRPSGR